MSGMAILVKKLKTLSDVFDVSVDEKGNPNNQQATDQFTALCRNRHAAAAFILTPNPTPEQTKYFEETSVVFNQIQTLFSNCVYVGQESVKAYIDTKKEVREVGADEETAILAALLEETVSIQGLDKKSLGKIAQLLQIMYGQAAFLGEESYKLTTLCGLFNLRASGVSLEETAQNAETEAVTAELAGAQNAKALREKADEERGYFTVAKMLNEKQDKADAVAALHTFQQVMQDFKAETVMHAADSKAIKFEYTPEQNKKAGEKIEEVMEQDMTNLRNACAHELDYLGSIIINEITKKDSFYLLDEANAMDVVVRDYQKPKTKVKQFCEQDNSLKLAIEKYDIYKALKTTLEDRSRSHFAKISRCGELYCQKQDKLDAQRDSLVVRLWKWIVRQWTHDRKGHSRSFTQFKQAIGPDRLDRVHRMRHLFFRPANPHKRRRVLSDDYSRPVLPTARDGQHSPKHPPHKTPKKSG